MNLQELQRRKKNLEDGLLQSQQLVSTHQANVLKYTGALELVNSLIQLEESTEKPEPKVEEEK